MTLDEIKQEILTACERLERRKIAANPRALVVEQKSEAVLLVEQRIEEAI